MIKVLGTVLRIVLRGILLLVGLVGVLLGGLLGFLFLLWRLNPPPGAPEKLRGSDAA